MAVPCLKSKLFSKTHSTVLPLFVYGDCMAYMLDFMHLLAMGVTSTLDLNHFGRCPHTFGHIVYFICTKRVERYKLTLIVAPGKGIVS